MSLFTDYNKEFMEVDKEVLIVALESALETYVPTNSDIRELMRLYIKQADDSRCEWDIDLDDMDR